jgi:hypothetical protein
MGFIKPQLQPTLGQMLSSKQLNLVKSPRSTRGGFDMSDEVTRAREHLKKEVWEFVDAVQDMDDKRVRDAFATVLNLITHIKRIEQRASDALVEDAQHLGMDDE